MHAMMVTVDIDAARVEESTKTLHEFTIPGAKAQPGFVRGTWMRSGDGTSGRGIVLFDTIDNANTCASMLTGQSWPADAPVQMRSVEIFEVVAEA